MSSLGQADAEIFIRGMALTGYMPSGVSGLRFRPYFITNLLHGGVESRAANTFRTRTLPRFRGTPVFNQDFKVRLGGPTDVLQFQLFNNRRLRRDPMVGQGTLAINDLWEAGAKGYALDRLVPIYGVEKPSALAVAPAGGVVDPGAVQLGTLRVLVRLAPLATGMTQHGMVTGSAATAASEAATMSNNPNIGGSGMGGARNSFTGGTGTGIGTGIGNTGYGQGGAGYGGTGTGAGLGAVAAGASGAGMGAGTYTPTGTTSLPMSQQGGYTGQPQQQMMGQNYSQTPKQQQPGPMYNTGMPQQQGQQQMGGYQQQGGLPTGAMEPLNTGSGSGVGTGTGGWPQQQQQGATGVHTPMHHTPMAQGQQQQPMMQQQQQPAQYGSQGQLNPSGVKTPMAYEQQAAGMQQYSQQSQLGQQQGYVGPAAGSDPQSHQTFAGQQGHAMNQPGIANPY